MTYISARLVRQELHECPTNVPAELLRDEVLAHALQGVGQVDTVGADAEHHLKCKTNFSS